MDIDNDNNDISINSENDEEEENISDNEGYNNFMKEYKQYCKGIKKAINKHIEGELNVQDLLTQANNFYLNNNYPKAKEVNLRRRKKRRKKSFFSYVSSAKFRRR